MARQNKLAREHAREQARKAAVRAAESEIAKPVKPVIPPKGSAAARAAKLGKRPPARGPSGKKP
jgi:hypothetical protein